MCAKTIGLNQIVLCIYYEYQCSFSLFTQETEIHSFITGQRELIIMKIPKREHWGKYHITYNQLKQVYSYELRTVTPAWTHFGIIILFHLKAYKLRFVWNHSSSYAVTRSPQINLVQVASRGSNLISSSSLSF